IPTFPGLTDWRPRAQHRCPDLPRGRTASTFPGVHIWPDPTFPGDTWPASTFPRVHTWPAPTTFIPRRRNTQSSTEWLKSSKELVAAVNVIAITLGGAVMAVLGWLGLSYGRRRMTENRNQTEMT